MGTRPIAANNWDVQFISVAVISDSSNVKCMTWTRPISICGPCHGFLYCPSLSPLPFTTPPPPPPPPPPSPLRVTKRIRDSTKCQQRYEVRRLFGCHNALCLRRKNDCQLNDVTSAPFFLALNSRRSVSILVELRPASNGQIASLPPSGETRPLILCNQSTHSV